MKKAELSELGQIKVDLRNKTAMYLNAKKRVEELKIKLEQGAQTFFIFDLLFKKYMTQNLQLSTADQLTEFLLNTSPNSEIKVEVFLHSENIWLTQDRMAELFGVQRPAITKHLANIFADKELDENMVSSILEHTTIHGAIEGKTQSQKVKFYNLDAIIAVGYRVNSKKATQFRIWATKILKEYIIKGFAMNDESLKNGRYFGVDYFRELLERIRSIRASERKIYQQITDIFAECSIDYDHNSDLAKNFYAMVQNKFYSNHIL